MCGIFGVLHHSPTVTPAEGLLRSIADRLAHRGPDGTGIVAAPGVGLVHTRLSLIDLNARSNQPFWDREGRYCLVYNGEIYNYRELRQGLENEGIVFRTTSDTEVLLESLLRYGAAAVLPQLQGMFAFALYDSRHRSLLIGRDRFGIKPLYVFANNELFAFSSEIKALGEYLKLEPDLLSISSYLEGFGGPSKGHTFFAGVKFVSPGEIIEAAPGRTAVHRHFFTMADFWDESEAEELQRAPMGKLVDEAERLLFASVQQHLIADLPVGALCSGGVDSSLIMAMASKIHNNLAIFHSNVVGPSSEYAAASLLAKHLKLDLKSVDVRDEDFIATVPAVMRHYEHPFSYHPNSIPFLRVSRLVREHGVKAVLSGEGSDECYLGYNEVVEQHPLLAYRKIPEYIRALLQRIPKVRAVIPPMQDRTAELMRALHNRFEAALDEEHTQSRLGAGCRGRGKYSESLELLNYHLRTLLHRNDALGMAASVEARFPFLDHELVKFAVNLPYEAKIRFAPSANPAHRFLRDKWIVREVARRYLPRELSQRRKLGFPFHTFGQMRIAREFFSASPLRELLGLSERGLRYLAEQAPAALTLRLFHLDVWAHTCLFRMDEAPLLDRLRRHVALPQPAAKKSSARFIPVLAPPAELESLVPQLLSCL
jgi:asparagine synthase (glutamine-hydrolysing)